MSSRLFQSTLSPVATRVRRKVIPRLTQISSTFYQNNTDSSNYCNRMPVIHAVAAHRHCHYLCQQQNLVPTVFVNGYFYGNDSNKREQSSHSSVSSTETSETLRNSRSSKQAPNPMTWFKSKSKNLISGENLLASNFFDASDLYECENECRRSYSKSKDKGSKKKSVVVINEKEMKEVLDLDSLKSNLQSVFNQMQAEYATQLNIRGAAGALEKLMVEFEGRKYPLQELAQIGRKNPQLAVLNLASLPDACKPVMNTILQCGMQLNPQQEGTTIFIPLPKVTREYRENLAKSAKTIFTKYKVSLQNVQNRFVKQCKSNSEVSEDVVFSVTQQIMKLTENFISEAEKLMNDKQRELLDTNS